MVTYTAKRYRISYNTMVQSWADMGSGYKICHPDWYYNVSAIKVYRYSSDGFRCGIRGTGEYYCYEGGQVFGIPAAWYGVWIPVTYTVDNVNRVFTDLNINNVDYTSQTAGLTAGSLEGRDYKVESTTPAKDGTSCYISDYLFEVLPFNEGTPTALKFPQWQQTKYGLRPFY